MPHIPRTPESLMSRSDSKNPATTCNGITTAGRPCRRSIAPLTNMVQNEVASSLQHPYPRPSAVDNARFFCWQHKEQAPPLVLANMAVNPLKTRNSFDTLLEQLGVLHIDEKAMSRRKTHAPSAKDRGAPSRENVGVLRKQSRSAKLSLCCWSPFDDDEYLEIVRHKSRIGNNTNVNDQSSCTSPRPISSHARNHGSKTASKGKLPLQSETDAQVPVQQSITLPDRNSWPCIPQSLPPNIRAQLLMELAKPTSAADEDGFIYIFWLTDSKTKSANNPANFPNQRNEGNARESGGQEQGETIGQKSSSTACSHVANKSGGKLLIKIGRATNVHRRLASWTHQCGYDLSLVRFYPHIRSNELGIPSSGDASHISGTGVSDWPVHSKVRKVPYSHRVERLVHIEMSERRVRQERCQMCGSVHREWFEIEASRKGLKLVDEVVSRWVEWAEGLRDSQG